MLGRKKKKIGWEPKISFQDLVDEMIREDLLAAERDKLIKDHGYRTLEFHE